MNQLGNDGTPFIFLIDFSGKSSIIAPTEHIDPNELLYSFSNKGNNPPQNKSLKKDFHWAPFPMDYADYVKAFDLVQQEIHTGNSYLLNLTFPTPISTNLSLKEIFFSNRAKYRIWWKDHFTVFSPESFVEIKDGKISSFPMKGTKDGTLPLAAQQLLEDPKEQAEHATIVDLIRNDLSRIAQKVRVERYRYVETLNTVNGPLLQTSSHISGYLSENYPSQIGSLLFTLLPAGSICGAPKPKTVDIIKEAEGYDRGFYTGICGIFDGTNLDSGVMIRFIEKTEHGLIFKSGGGITAQSDARAEYDELIQKIYLPIPLTESKLA